MRRLSRAIEIAEDVARDVLAPQAGEIDREARWPEAGMRALQESGLGGLVAPSEVGGWGLGFEALARVTESLGAQCASTSLCFGMHCVGTAVIAAKATPKQTERYLEPIAAGRHLTSLALSEPGTGSHFYIPRTRLTKNHDGWVVNGAKSFVTNAGHADSYVLSAQADDRQAPQGEFSCVLLDAGADGVEWQGAWRGLGMRGNESRNLELHDVALPPENLLGEEGDQIWYIFEVVAPYFLVAMAGTYLGVATAAIEEARDHLRRRHQGHTGEPLAHVGVLQHRLGELWGRLEAVRSLTHRAGAVADAGGDKSLEAIMAAKAEVADVATQTVNQVLTLVGGAAYQEDGVLGRLLRDVRAAHVMSPTTDLLRTWLGRSFLGLPLLME